jgi:hypothetical protein
VRQIVVEKISKSEIKVSIEAPEDVVKEVDNS